ncbi:MAG: DUF3127 domain-containing protein [Bacteroidia bacterium]|nr:DUF3127 domain-containing protein [Bacteroidia bacterium]NNC84493.1 DUF3127 domain-containing protein [Bacteroidia bacterium]
MGYQITGKLLEKFDTVQATEKFKKREFVIEVNSENTSFNRTDVIKFQLTQDRCNLIDSAAINDSITVFFDIRGNKWEKEGRVMYFTNLEAWRVSAPEVVDAPSSVGPEPFVEPGNMPDISSSDSTDDLPF